MKKKKLIKDFGKFVSIGFIWSGINVMLVWLLVDFMGITALLSSTISIIVALLGRFYSYLLIGLIHPNFIKFATANVTFTLLNIALVTLAIDILKLNTLIASVTIIGGLVLLKFIVFNKINLIKN